MNARELLARYAAGERQFSNVILSQADLRDADLREFHLSDADLSKANLCAVNLSKACLDFAYIKIQNSLRSTR